MGPFIVPLTVRQARHLPCVLNLHFIRLCVRKDPHPRIGDKGGCAYRFTTYRDSDFAVHDRHFTASTPTVPGVGGAAECAHLLGRDPSEWIRSLSRWQTIDAARQLQRDACLMTSNHNVLDQYALLPPWDGVEVTGIGGEASWLSVHGYGFCCARARTHGSYGPVAPSDRPWWAGSGLCPSGPDCPRPSCLNTVIVRLTAGSCSAGDENSVYAGSCCWMNLNSVVNISNFHPVGH